MSSYQGRTSYDRLYEATQVEARYWSPICLTIALTLMLAKQPQDEARWGAVDAVTDLLGRIKPPVWRDEMR